MRVLVVVPHFFKPMPTVGYDSHMKNPKPRVAALSANITSLRQLFDTRQYMFLFQSARADAVQANDGDGNVLDIVICTTGGRHLLDRLPVPESAYTHRATDVEPMLLGFECQAVLRDALGQYDYYCYMEEDLVIHDPWFFSKLAWFSDRAGNAALLQPNRYERDSFGGGRKAYVDGDLDPELTAQFQSVGRRRVRTEKILGRKVAFCRSLNPHSGCYFLNQRQMEQWAGEPHFLDRDTSFVGPLESAATLGIMRTFDVYKPAPAYADFFEIEHSSGRYMALLSDQSPEDRPPLELTYPSFSRQARAGQPG
jgi:hypothetical protein